MHPCRTVRLNVVSFLLAVLLVACGGPPATVLPEPVPSAFLTKESLMATGKECEAAFTKTPQTGTLTPPLAAFYQVDGAQGWQVLLQFGIFRALQPEDVQGLVCVRSIEHVRGSYTDGSSAVQVEYDARFVDRASGNVIGAAQFMGGAPPSSGIANTGDTRGFSPDAQLIAHTATLVGDDSVFAHGGGVTRLVYSPDSTFLAVGGLEPALTLWDLTTRQQVVLDENNVLFQGTGNFGFTPDGRQLVVARETGAVEYWNPQPAPVLVDSLQIEGNVIDLAFTPTDQELRLLVARGGFSDRTVVVITGAPPREQTLGAQKPFYAKSVVFSPDGQTVAKVADKSISFWDPTTGKLTKEFWGDDLVDTAFSPDSLYVVGWKSKAISVWEYASGKELYRFASPVPNTPTSNQDIHKVSVSPNGAFLAIGRFAGDIWLQSLPPTEPPRLLGVHGGLLTALTFAPDGRTLVSADDTGVVKLWDIQP
jgi:hypothetical protein